ncbi:MAG: hypothetical protein ACM34I_05000 [bacterium]
MNEKIRDEYEKSLAKRDEIRQELKNLEKQSPQDSYTITITRDRLAYWEGRCEGLKFALDTLEQRS